MGFLFKTLDFISLSRYHKVNFPLSMSSGYKFCFPESPPTNTTNTTILSEFQKNSFGWKNQKNCMWSFNMKIIYLAKLVQSINIPEYFEHNIKILIKTCGCGLRHFLHIRYFETLYQVN